MNYAQISLRKPKQKGHLEEPGTEGCNTLKLSTRNRIADMDWTALAQDRNVWQATANMMNLWV
jgi:hypothetical protein